MVANECKNSELNLVADCSNLLRDMTDTCSVSTARSQSACLCFCIGATMCPLCRWKQLQKPTPTTINAESCTSCKAGSSSANLLSPLALQLYNVVNPFVHLLVVSENEHEWGGSRQAGSVKQDKLTNDLALLLLWSCSLSFNNAPILVPRRGRGRYSSAGSNAKPQRANFKATTELVC